MQSTALLKLHGGEMVNWSAVAAIISGVTLLFVLLGGAHFSGKIVEKVTAHDQKFAEVDNRFGEVDDRLDRYGNHLQRVDIALVKLEKYQEGFADGLRSKEKENASKVIGS
jgi:hypothetical protein